MWTPRRVLVLVFGFVACAAIFGVYYRFLGWIDGLPTLPEKYRASSVQEIRYDLPPDEPMMLRRIKQAFGERCPELGYTIKLTVQSQEILLVTDRVEIEPDGRIKLTPFSLAIFGNKRLDNGFPEINVVHCDIALVAFDRKIETLSDMGKSKIVAAEFVGDKSILSSDPRKGAIHVVNNHGTPQRDDDLEVTIPGPVYFRDRPAGQQPQLPHLWTRSVVHVTDYQSKPPHVVTAQGMNIYLREGLVAAPDRAALKGDKPANQTVKSVELTNVHMQLTQRDQSGFPGGESSSPPQSKNPSDDKFFLTITTLGPFRYDLEKDLATFEIAPPTGDAMPQCVEVVRSSKTTGNDVVQCDRLDIQFRRKSSKAGPGPALAPDTPPGSDPAGALEVVEARAAGSVVVLTSDSEKLHARGNVLTFNQATRTSVLRGEPLTAVRDGNKIQAAELELHQIDEALLRKATADEPVVAAKAKGPGIIWLLDRENQRTVEVRWTDSLRVDRWPDTDRIHLTGGAVFEDREHQQLLQGDQIKIWLMPAAATATPAANTALDQSKARPRQVRVIGNVRAATPELKVNRTVLLDIWFQDVPALPELKPGVGPDRGNLPTLSAAPAPAPPQAGSLLPKRPGEAQPAAPGPQPDKKPLEVCAQVIEAFVLRAGPRNELDKVICHERVTIHQDATKPGERGLDVASNELTLTHTPDGDVLELSAKRPALAKVESQQLMLYGNQIVFDQRENRAIVDGAGNMKMWAASTLNGEKRPNPVPISVFWNDRMTFIGSLVSFQGGVQAVQEGTKVLCPKLDVYFDRVISLKRTNPEKMATGNPGDDDQPKIVKAFCHNGGQPAAAPVTITDVVYEKGELVRYQRIEAPEVTFDNDQGIVRAPGKGEVRTLQPGEKSATDPFAEQKPSTGAPPEMEMKLIRIRYDDRMELNTKLRTAQFYRNIQALYVPTENPNLAVDENRLPPAAFVLRCDRLEVSSNQTNGQTLPSMKADGHADLQSREFSGRADTIKYDEGRDKQQQVIFESTSSAPASLSRIEAPGRQPQELLGKTILYWRKTNAFKVIGAVGASGAQ